MNLSRKKPSVIDNMKSSIINCLLHDNLFMIKLLIDNNILNITELESILKKSTPIINNETIADYFVNIGLDAFSLETLQSFLDLYIYRGWFSTEFIQLINFGVRLPNDKINYYLKVPDDIFFTYFENENYVCDDIFFNYCVRHGTVIKLKKLTNMNNFGLLNYYSYCIISLQNPNFDMLEYFLDYLSNDRILLFIFFLEIISMRYSVELIKIRDDMIDKLKPLSAEELFLSLMIAHGTQDNYKLKIMFFELTKINICDYPKNYFDNHYLKDNHLSTIYCQLKNEIEIERLNRIVPENNIQIIYDWLSQCTVLLQDLK
jgi:hypothetical protein